MLSDMRMLFWYDLRISIMLVVSMIGEIRAGSRGVQYVGGRP